MVVSLRRKRKNGKEEMVKESTKRKELFYWKH
jgi:hypothetical protein